METLCPKAMSSSILQGLREWEVAIGSDDVFYLQPKGHDDACSQGHFVEDHCGLFVLVHVHVFHELSFVNIQESSFFLGL